MRLLLAVVIAIGVASASPAQAATIHGLVFDDANGDGVPSAGEAGVANAVVAFGVQRFVVTDAAGQFDIDVVDGARGIVWARVPDGFTPGPVWGRWDGAADIDLALHRLATPVRGPFSFVVASDTHLPITQEYITAADLALAATNATATDPAPAFFTILGDITQSNQEFDLVETALAGLEVPWIPVPGNHDWYDGGAAWFKHFGPDNYSFDIGDTHFVVWNMAMNDTDIRTYLGAELQRVPRTMTIVALTHAPPSEPVIDALRELGVDYVLTGHAHSNRVVDHGGLIELNTQPMLMGGLDFTPGGYRVITFDHGRLTSVHRSTVESPLVTIVSPSRGACAPARGAALVVAAELDASTTNITARVDCASPIAMRAAGGWNWRAELPPLAPGPHTIVVEANAQSGAGATTTLTVETCETPPPPLPGPAWPQLGGDATHVGTRPYEVVPPLVTRWASVVGGHVLSASPVIAQGLVFVTVTDLGDGASGGVVALDLLTGAQRWRVPTPVQVRGGLAIAGDTVVATQIDGLTLALDATTGAQRWRYELSTEFEPEAAALFAPPAVDHDDVLVGNQRALAVLASASGTPLWSTDPVPAGRNSQSAAALAIGDGIVVGTFERAVGGLLAWDRATGKLLWSRNDFDTIGINASPVIAGDTIYTVSAADTVAALDLAGQLRWRTALDSKGFEWGNATIGTPAYAQGVLVVPTLYRDLVALDALTGVELWRHAGVPSPLRTTHYRGARESGFAAAPIITGDLVWAVDTAGELSALELHSGSVMWHTSLGVPVLAGLAASGDWLIAASYDGTVRALVPTPAERPVPAPVDCTAPPPEPPPSAGCCDTTGSPASLLLALVVVVGLRRRRA
ncbi:MAG TPA: PQQ-binding-like beta-propeller repeat protein [Kofleriaceae bacterium]|nr:PQQ-binding-like beta-propeller repeat protein [Kofleriaceae bacterium]